MPISMCLHCARRGKSEFAVIFRSVPRAAARTPWSNAQGEVTSESLWSRYDRHFVGITRRSMFN